MTSTDKIPAAYLRKRLAYDPETGILTWLPRSIDEFESSRTYGNWMARLPGKPAFMRKNVFGYRAGEIAYNGKRVCLLAHKAAFVIWHGRWPTHTIDHINGVRDDNRICNLREATRLQNAQNTRGSGRYLQGAQPCSNGKWRASIGHKYKTIYLGTFESEQEAHDAYREACLKLRGEFALLEFREAA